jgi:endonuclease G
MEYEVGYLSEQRSGAKRYAKLLAGATFTIYSCLQVTFFLLFSAMENYQGYQADFMGEGLEVPLPELVTAKQADLAPELPYTHFSVYLSRSRRFPYFTATNVNGRLARKIPREQVFAGGADRWEVDSRCPGFQWGQLLYTAPQSDFQRGHMTKREDPQWGSTDEIARRAAQDTFKFSNCVPQVKSLNIKAWGQLEMYILRKKAIPDSKLVNIFTGPVLAANAFSCRRFFGKSCTTLTMATV